MNINYCSIWNQALGAWVGYATGVPSSFNNNLGAGAGRQSSGNNNNNIGNGAGGRVVGDKNSSMGYWAGIDSAGNNSLMLGNFAGQSSTGDQNVFLGQGAGGGNYVLGKVNGNDNIAIGTYANLYGGNINSTIAIGNGAMATADQAVALGTGARATGASSISIGTGNEVSGKNSGAFGDPNTVSGAGSYAFGNNNTIAQDNTFVLGTGVTTTQANSVVLGNASTDRAATAVTGITINGKAYTFAGVGSAASGVASVGSKGGERQLINVAAGEISQTSTDAINGSQLYATNQAIGNLSSTVTANKTKYFSVNSTGGGNEDMGTRAGQSIQGSRNIANGWESGRTIVGNNNIAQGPQTGNQVTGNFNQSAGYYAGSCTRSPARSTRSAGRS